MRNLSPSMSQKPRASRMAIVRISALASMDFFLGGREKAARRQERKGRCVRARGARAASERWPFRSSLRRVRSFKRLILAEISHGETQRIDGNQFVGDATLEGEY